MTTDPCFLFGAVQVCLKADDAEFVQRFEHIFHDCRVTRQSKFRPDVVPLDLEVCALSVAGWVRARMPGHDSRAAAATLACYCPELGLNLSSGLSSSDRRCFVFAGQPETVRIVAAGDLIELDRTLPWQIVVVHYLVAHVIRMQPEYVFFHAATVRFGAAGVYLSGDRGAGKSTLSLAMVARGGQFLGDELGVVHKVTGRMQAFPRSVAIRPGPQSKSVEAFLERNQPAEETLADGTRRVRMPVSMIFPEAIGTGTTMTHAFFLCGVGLRPTVHEFNFSWANLPLLGHLYPSLDSMSASARAMCLLRMFARPRCFLLCPGGSPDDTAEMIQNCVEEQ